MAATILKVEAELEVCYVCGRSDGELQTPEEYDAGAPHLQVPLRTMLLQLNVNKVVPEGRLCGVCAQRAVESYEFSNALSSKSAPPLSEKIRALRRRLHELTQKIDVFIVVGGPGAAGNGNAYSEDDIIMVEKDALAAAVAADCDELESARNAKGDAVYQCSVCPLSFQRAGEYRSHVLTHPEESLHCCWTCGAQFALKDALQEHAATHAVLQPHACHLCDTAFESAGALRRHELLCPPRCPGCGQLAADRATLAEHCAQQHGRDAPPPHVCPACFRSFAVADLLSAHLLKHRQAKQFVCGYGDCVLRFANRRNLMAHIRSRHSAELEAPPPVEVVCDVCQRTFASAAALKRHARVHRAEPEVLQEEEVVEGGEYMEGEYVEYVYETTEGDEEVEYLEEEALDETELEDVKYQI